MEADHVRDRGKKLENLSLISFWVSHGGVEGMEREGRKCQPLCRFCHALKSFRERTEDRARQIFSCTKKAMASRERRASRQAYVNEIKQTVGKCIDCGRKVQEGNEAGFDLCIEPGEKGHFAGCRSRVSMHQARGGSAEIDEEVKSAIWAARTVTNTERLGSSESLRTGSYGEEYRRDAVYHGPSTRPWPRRRSRGRRSTPGAPQVHAHCRSRPGLLRDGSRSMGT